MSKVAVVYWTGTGNTQKMAQKVIDGAKKAGAEVTEIFADSFHEGDVASYDAIALGCPAMGAEVLEESVFQPMWDEVKPAIKGKKIGLFGSWGWGGGVWMEDWTSDAESTGADLVGTVTANNEPDHAADAECEALGEKLA